MRKSAFLGLIFTSAALLAASPAFGHVTVGGYSRSNGTYVAPYVRTAPDSSRLNNYSTKGNINPYTGQEGHVEPWAVRPVPQSARPVRDLPLMKITAVPVTP